MAASRSEPVEAARTTLGLSTAALWIDYFALGGILAPRQVNAFLAGYGDVSDLEHDILVHALNERFTDRNQDHPVAYSEPSPAEHLNSGAAFQGHEQKRCSWSS